jgi:HPt (histidine-containing phosphotransfer) domain-containing protein
MRTWNDLDSALPRTVKKRFRKMTRNATVSEFPAEAGNCSFRLRNVRYGEAVARFGGDETRFRHWLLDFTGYGVALVGQIRAAIATASIDIAISRAHALKGRVGMLGMADLHALAQALEVALRNGEAVTPGLDELERAVMETSAEISAALGKNAA